MGSDSLSQLWMLLLIFNDPYMIISFFMVKVGIAYYENAGRGLQAQKRIKNGELLLKIPKDVLLTPGIFRQLGCMNL